MKALVTGGCGFVGRRLVRRLAALDNQITVIDNLISGQHPENWMFPAEGKVQYHFADVRTQLRGLKPDQFDLVVHCAAVVGGRLTIENDPLLVATDLSIDAELFNWIVRGENKPHLIYFSSSAVYPTELQTRRLHCDLAEGLVTFDATRVSLPDMTYGFAKLAGEYLAKFAKENYGLPVTIYRPFSGYGEDQHHSYPMPAIVKRVLDGENPVTVWGSGEQVRDWVYIEDVIDAVLATWQEQGTWNIGTGEAVSFSLLASKICDILGREPASVQNDPSKPEGVFYRVADTHKISGFWTPKISLEVGIRKVAEALDKAKVSA